MTLVELTSDQYLASIWQALRRIETSLSVGLLIPELPTPQVTVNTEPPDLSLLMQAVQAVTNLHPGPSADEIARALAGVLAPRTSEPAAPISDLVEALRLLNHRLQGFGGGVARASGGGSVTLAPGQTVNIGNWTESLSPPVAATVTAVPASTTSVVLVASNSAREGVAIYNEPGSSNLRVKHGVGATVDSYTVLLGAGDLYEPAPPAYVGLVTGIWETTTGRAMVTEMVA